jgi:hypothetical protein
MSRPWLRVLAFVAGAALTACASAPTAVPVPPPPVGPPEIEFAGLVTEVSIYNDHYEFTDLRGTIHAIDLDEYRQVGDMPCCGELLVLGVDEDGAFMTSFMTQGGLPDDCYVENDPGIDRGSHIEINGVLWAKARAFEGVVPPATWYAPATRFCFDQHGRVTSIVPP